MCENSITKKSITETIPTCLEKIENALTNEQLDEVVKTIEENTSEQVNQMRELHEKVEAIDNSEDELEKERVDMDLTSPASCITEDKNAYNRADISLFDISKESISNLDEVEMEKHITHTSKELFNLDDESIFNLLSIVKEYKKNKNYPVWANMSPRLKGMIKIMALNSGAPVGSNAINYQMIAKQMVQTFIDEAEMDQSFIDLEKSLNDALNIPSIIDMYTEHTNEVMNTKIPEMIAELRNNGEDEKANKLLMVKQSFTDAYDLHLLEEAYLNTTRIRREVRKNWGSCERFATDLNYANKKTKFMMNDANQIYDALDNVLDETYDHADIEKFIVLVAMSLENLDRNDLPQAAYIYYLIKNLTILRLTNEAKTDFSIELINNIKRVINMIRNKEDEFNNVHARVQHKPKRSVKNRNNRK